MLTFKTMLLFTALLVVPVFIAFWNLLQQENSMFLQMMFGYTGCYFMKNFYALLNRAVNGIENDGVEMDWIAMLATSFFLIATWSCLRQLSGAGRDQMDLFKSRLQVFLIVGIVAVLVESFAGTAGNRILFIACYLVSVTCIYVVTVMTRVKVKGAVSLQESTKMR